MAWSAPVTRATDFFVTAAIWNQDVVDNPTELRAGGIAVTSQAVGNDIYATSATQFGARTHAESHLDNWMSYLGGEI